MAIQKRLTAQNHRAPAAPPGTVANARMKDTGRFLAATPAPSLPTQVSLEFLRRGQERYDIHCAPCHDRAGEGLGIVVMRGFKRPRPLSDPLVRKRTDDELFKIVTDGYQTMPGYLDEITESDRLAIVAFIRALQLSRSMPASELKPEDREALEKTESQ
jgi:mono/diheme cytochrome c family protein